MINQEYSVIHYEENGRDIVREWLEELKDSQGKAAIYRALKKVEQGNFGDHKYCRDGVSELRIHVGAGYRVYYSIVDGKVILLLCGGSKRTQPRDISKAVEYLKNFLEAKK